MASATATDHSQEPDRSTRAVIIRLLVQLWPWVFLLIMLGYFQIAAGAQIGTNFLSARNVSNILVSSTLIMLMAVGQTFVIITAGIDLSVGWTVGLSSVIAATVMRDLGDSGMAINSAIGLGILAGLAVSLVPGFVNGILVAKVKIPPFIATIGMFGIVRGAAFLLTDGKNVVGNIPSAVRETLRRWATAAFCTTSRIWGGRG